MNKIQLLRLFVSLFLGVLCTNEVQAQECTMSLVRAIFESEYIDKKIVDEGYYDLRPKVFEDVAMLEPHLWVGWKMFVERQQGNETVRFASSSDDAFLQNAREIIGETFVAIRPTSTTQDDLNQNLFCEIWL